MRVSKNDVICGLPAPMARRLMREYRDEHPVGVACDVLGLGRKAAREQLRAFEAGGYVERSERSSTAGDDWWVTTIRGNELAQTSFGKPISRATAARHLAGVVELVSGCSANTRQRLTVAEV